MVQVHSSKILLVQVRFGFIDLKFNCRYSFRPEKEKKKEIADPVDDHQSPRLLLCVYQPQRHSDMEKYIFRFGLGSLEHNFEGSGLVSGSLK